MITENMKSINIIGHTLKVPKFRGHMKLELKGSRETKVIEHENSMTKAMETMLDPYGLWVNPSGVMAAISPTLSNFFGGILLTDKEIPEESLAIPGGIEVNACAAYGTSNLDTALTQGSYNEKESVLDLAAKKMTYVYDWTTNQGNGTIAAAALSNVNAGYCIYGDAGVDFDDSRGYEFYIQSSNGTPISAYKYVSMEAALITNDYEYYIETSVDKITVYKVKGNVNTALPFSLNWWTGTNKNLYFDYAKYEKYTYDTIDLRNKTIFTDGRNIYILKSEYVYANYDFILYKIDTNDMSIKAITLKNNSGNTLNTSYGIEIYGDYIYLPENQNGSFYEISIPNPTDIKKYTLNGTKQILFNRIISLQNGKIYFQYNSKAVVFDVVTKTIKATKIREAFNMIPITSGIRPILQNNRSMITYLSRLYLATINNLDAPITKTADKTMKVTYTIQEVT
ncbi:MAG: hypothetical protein NC393_08070 [Clostridium sp.]|nr:hypothetical protein [Clostridium sp.]MCM1207655.1 hypothetical protein [Ruminococcus sp.]